MKLSYFDKLSPCGVYINGLGRVKSPMLKDIGGIGYQRYQYYVTLLSMQPRDFISVTRGDDAVCAYDKLPTEEKEKLNTYKLFTSDDAMREDIASALGFFISGKIEFDAKSNSFLVNRSVENGVISADGKITEINFDEVTEICLQLVYIETEKPKALKFKNERARKFYERFQKAKAASKKTSKTSPNYELANIISALAVYSESLNHTNIWDLTVYQIYDVFGRQQRKNQTLIHDQNYSVWGGKYDPEDWFARMDKKV